MTCKLCKKEKHLWDDNKTKPVCYFDDVDNNWNCATLSQLRKLAYTEYDRIYYNHYNDQSELYVRINDIIKDSLTLYVTWYKNRGRTEQVWILSDNNVPRIPSEKELKKIIKDIAK